jgi:hypothetical protein
VSCAFLSSDEGFAIVFADVVDGVDVEMIQRGGCLRFAFEAAEGLLVASHFVGKKFQRDEALQASVFGFVNYAHASGTEIFDDAVMGDGETNQRRAVRHESAILDCE